MKNIRKTIYSAVLMAVAAGASLVTSCDKVSPTGLLVTNSSTDERVEMSIDYFKNHERELGDMFDLSQVEEYTFLVGSDSHMTTDTTRMAEMFRIAMANKDILCAHLGDIADTKTEYYIALEDLIQKYSEKYFDYLKQFCQYDAEKEEFYYIDEQTGKREILDPKTVNFPFYVTVGNHDLTRNGWAMFSNIFHATFFQVYVYVNDKEFDRLIFLDSANGTLGTSQLSEIENELFLDGKEESANMKTRNIFVFTHTNIFRPRENQVSSTYPREEMYFMLNKFQEWNAKIVFLGHVHWWEEREFGGIKYLTLDAMSERNNPDPGDYLVRVHVKKNGDVSYERVHMSTTGKK